MILRCDIIDFLESPYTEYESRQTELSSNELEFSEVFSKLFIDYPNEDNFICSLTIRLPSSLVNVFFIYTIIYILSVIQIFFTKFV